MKRADSTPAFSIADESTWPLRMVRAEIIAVLRVSEREFYRRLGAGRFPKADDGKTWHRDFVVRYVNGGIKAFEKAAEKQRRKQV